jgi:flagellar hook-associated protein 3 FlgL
MLEPDACKGSDMTGFSALSRLDHGASMLRTRYETLTRQLSDTRRGPTLGDIAPSVPRAIDLRGEVARRAAYATVIDRSLGQVGVAQTSLQALFGIATRAFALAQSASTANPVGVAAAAVEARVALAQATELLNTQIGGVYVFGGLDTTRPPVPNAAAIGDSGMVQQITAAVQGLGGSDAAAVWAATGDAASSDAPGVTPFSDYASDPARGLADTRTSVPGADGQLVAAGLFANRNAGAASTGETTGSWARDLLRGLASLAALGSDQLAQGPPFDTLMVSLRSGLRAASAGIAQEQGALGVAEVRLGAMRTDHEAVTTILTLQLANIEEVDVADVITRMKATEAQLEASYRAISMASTLSLARFL